MRFNRSYWSRCARFETVEPTTRPSERVSMDPATGQPTGSRLGRHVVVPAWDDSGTVIERGSNVGMPDHHVHTVIIHFEATGEVVHYDSMRARLVD